jgi:hypothetical protein
MSRTFNEHHPSSHSKHGRTPAPYLDKDGDVPRRKKMKPYGRKRSGMFGGEKYYTKWGDVIEDVINTSSARSNWKKEIENELYD